MGPTLQPARAPRGLLAAIVSDRFHGAVVEGILAEGLLVRRLRLLVNVGEACFIVADEVCRRGFATQIAIDALGIDVVSTGRLAGDFIIGISQSGLEVRAEQSRALAILSQEQEDV